MNPSLIVAVCVKLAKAELLVEDIRYLNTLIEPLDDGLK
jgi:hypothetical protein